MMGTVHYIAGIINAKKFTDKADIAQWDSVGTLAHKYIIFVLLKKPPEHRLSLAKGRLRLSDCGVLQKYKIPEFHIRIPIDQ
jgi:hypothetical protein